MRNLHDLVEHIWISSYQKVEKDLQKHLHGAAPARILRSKKKIYITR